MREHYKTILQAIASAIGPAVLIPVPYASKKPLDTGWTTLTLEQTQTPEYMERFSRPCNIGVLLGVPSLNLCTLDVDADEDAAYFLALNPHLEGTLRTAGARGCNFWLRVKGEYPPLTKIYHRTDTQGDKPRAVGEWRSTGGQTIIHGQHPSGCNYRRVVDAPAIEIEFSSINWPSDWKVPWIKTEEELFVERYGPPFTSGAQGRIALNQVYFAAKFAVEHDVLWEAEEREFYLYKDKRGLWQQASSDHLKTLFSDDLIEFSRLAKLPALVAQRNNTLLNSLVDLLRGIVEKTGVFANRQRGLIHLVDGMLDLNASPPVLREFSKEFYSRNQCPIALDESARCPQFEQLLLRSALDEDDVSLLQRWSGAVLLGGNHAQKILLLAGTAGGGKSTVVEVLEQIIGLENIIELRPPQLNERFEIGRFLGKSLLTGKDAPGHFLETEGASALKIR